MNPQKAYTHWSDQYDTNYNRTRDLEAIALRKELAAFLYRKEQLDLAKKDRNENDPNCQLQTADCQLSSPTRNFMHVLELGCGTGKNTVFFAEMAKAVTAVDLTEAMLQKAREKVKDVHVQFVQADLLQPWQFANDTYDLITFSLVLEHIEHLQPILQKAEAVLQKEGLIYIGELHPFKQYSGSKARFEMAYGVQEVECYNHHLSDFVQAATAAGLRILSLNEYFDTDDRRQLPRVLTLLLQKS